MALISCIECQHPISTEATTCPECGRPRQLAKQGEVIVIRKYARRRGFAVVLLLGGMMIIFSEAVPGLGSLMVLISIPVWISSWFV
jgi:hypothetical protein